MQQSPSRRWTRLWFITCTLATLVLIGGCAQGSKYRGSADWSPQAGQEGAQVAPNPAPDSPASPSKPSDPNNPTPQDDGVRASGLNQPWAVAPLGDGTALVGERTTGVVTRVVAQPGTAQSIAFTIPGIDATGDGGLLGMVASPKFAEDGLVYAYVSTATDNRIISVNLSGAVVPLITGIPKGPDHNGGALAVGPDGNLYVATGDTGNPALASDPASLAGKVLRFNQFGEPVDGSLSVANGFTNPTGLCFTSQAGYVVDAGTSLKSLNNQGAGFSTPAPLLTYQGTTAGAASCAATNAAVITTTLAGASILTSSLDKDGKPQGDPQLSLTAKYGQLRALALDQVSGGMWVGTYNRDGVGTPAADDDRILFIPPTSSGSSVA